MTMKKPNAARGRKFFALTYNSEGLLQKITTSGAEKWAYCTHDRDVNEDGEQKKIHTHIVIAFENAVTCNSVAKKIGTEPNFVEVIKRGDERGALRYLIHADNPEKVQYGLDEVIRRGYNNSVWTASESEEENIMRVMDIIESGNCRSYTDLIRQCTAAGCWAELRRGGYLFARALEEQIELQKVTQPVHMTQLKGQKSKD